MKQYYPIFLDLRERPCLVVGGGEVAERKVFSLLESGAQVSVVSPLVTEELMKLAESHRIEYHRRGFCPDDLKGRFLVIGATNRSEVNQEVALECGRRNILCNIVDDPTAGSYVVPAVVRQGPLSIAISTDGSSPYLSRKIRDKIAKDFGPEYGEFLTLMAELRPKIITNIPNIEDRRRVFREFVDSDIIDLLRQKNYDKVKERVAHVLGSGWSQS